MLFGPLWIMLHFYAFFLPKGQLDNARQVAMRHFIEYFITLIPCGGCSMHAGNYFINNFQTLAACTTGQHFFEWTVAFHNFVNRSRFRREFLMVEAERALLMHLSDKSAQQNDIEDANTHEIQEIRKLEHTILILQNQSHRIPKETHDTRLTQMHNQTIYFEPGALRDVFRAIFLIAMERNSEKPIDVRIGHNAREFLRIAFELFPNAKIAQDSIAFHKKANVKFELGQDFFRYVLRWYNEVSGDDTRTEQSILLEIRAWSATVQKRQFAITGAVVKHRETIKKLQTKHEELFAVRQHNDAVGSSSCPTVPLWLTITTVATIVILIILLIVFIVLYAKQCHVTKRYTTQIVM